MSLRKNVCPECGGSITVWFDVNTEVRYAVHPGGGLSKAMVVTDDTGESKRQQVHKKFVLRAQGKREADFKQNWKRN